MRDHPSSPSTPSLLPRCMLLVFGWLVAFPASVATAAPVARDAELCEIAASEAADAVGVPLDILRALALTETGRHLDGAFRPWPWALNIQGQGHWLNSKLKAHAHARRAIESGIRNLDIGCFQINHRWHGDSFDSVRDMLDPATNARYAARFLKRMHDETGSWSDAAGAYHSRTPELAQRYRARFKQIRARLDAAPRDVELARPQHQPGEARPERTARRSPYPLLTGGGKGRNGSLLSATARSGAQPLIDTTASAGLLQ